MIKQIFSSFALGCLTMAVMPSLADVEVLQYQSANNQVVKYTVPLDSIGQIVVQGNLAWAIDQSQDDSYISFFDGKKWNTPYDLPGDTEDNYLHTIASSTGVVAGLGAYKRHQDAQGNGSWQTEKSQFGQSANGRFWELKASPFKYGQEVLYVNQTIGQDNLTLIKDAASSQAIAVIPGEQIIGYDRYAVAYYDQPTDTDYLKIFYPVGDQPLSDAKIQEYTCSVAHQSKDPAADVRCVSKQLALQTIMPAYASDNLKFDTFKLLDDNVIDTTLTDATTNKNIELWSSDFGATWSYSKPYSEGALGVLPPDNHYLLPNQCMIESVDSSTSMSGYIFPPTYTCLDATSTSNPRALKNHAFQAMDLDKTSVENAGMRAVTSYKGIWISNDDVTNHHLYYLDFASGKSQELAAVPGASDFVHSQFAIFTNPGTSDKVVSCSASAYTDKGVSKQGLRVQLATNSNGAWQWSSPDVSIDLPSANNVCAISTDQNRAYEDKEVFAANKTIWAFAAQVAGKSKGVMHG